MKNLFLWLRGQDANYRRALYIAEFLSQGIAIDCNMTAIAIISKIICKNYEKKQKNAPTFVMKAGAFYYLNLLVFTYAILPVLMTLILSTLADACDSTLTFVLGR